MIAEEKGYDSIVETIDSLINNDKYKCKRCLKTGRDLGRVLKKCNGCKKVYYCGGECQKAHWKVHKSVCSR